MGKRTFTRAAFTSAKSTEGVSSGRRVTAAAERQAMATGKLEALVDPAGFGVIRLSLPRVEKTPEELWEMLVGCPLPVETCVDTTGSMGDNVDVAMKVMPNAFESIQKVTDGYDVQIATGIFGDFKDRFILCRPQFEMEADKIVKQLTLMVPEGGGQDHAEDPDYSLFAGAYLCRHYINRIGLKGYHFIATDAPGRGMIDPAHVVRVFGEEAWDKVAENGHRIRKGQHQTSDVWEALLDRAHAFVLQVGDCPEAKAFWLDVAGEDRLISLPQMRFMPQVQAVIIGLTEGTLVLNDVPGFLEGLKTGNETIKPQWIDKIVESVVNVPVGAQQQLPDYGRRPQKGDLFDGKPDVWEDNHIWPIESAAEAVETEDGDDLTETTDDDQWL